MVNIILWQSQQSATKRLCQLREPLGLNLMIHRPSREDCSLPMQRSSNEGRAASYAVESHGGGCGGGGRDHVGHVETVGWEVGFVACFRGEEGRELAPSKAGERDGAHLRSGSRRERGGTSSRVIRASRPSYYGRRICVEANVSRAASKKRKRA